MEQPPQSLFRSRDLFLHFLGRAVALAEQDGLGAQVVAGVDEILDRRRHGPVHHLQACGDNTGGNDRTQVFNQPGTAGGGIAVRDGATTTIIGPGGRITSVPAQR